VVGWRRIRVVVVASDTRGRVASDTRGRCCRWATSAVRRYGQHMTDSPDDDAVDVVNADQLAQATTFVGTDAAAAKLDALMARPGMASAVAGIHAEMAADDADGGRRGRGYALTDGADLWADLVGPFYDTATVASVLGVTVAAVRGRRARGGLLGLRTRSGRVVFPVWQFGHGRVLPGLGPVLRVLGDGVSGWTVAAWLRSPDVELDGRTPLQVLATDPDLVLLVASRAAAGWAR